MRNFNPAIQSLFDQKALALCNLWEITRVDGTVYRFTDLDRAVNYEGEQFVPTSGGETSAHEAEEGALARNLELRGFIDDTTILHDDLLAGRFKRAQVTQTCIDWRHPEWGAVYERHFWIADVEYDDRVWVVEMVGLSHLLEQPFGRRVTMDCRHTVGQAGPNGEPGCIGYSGDGVDLTDSAYLQSGRTVSSIVKARKVFHTDIPTSSGYDDSWWKHGQLTWTSGLNNGLKFDVRASRETNGKIWLEVPTPFDIAVSDGFSITVGCNWAWSTCKDKFSNSVNYGGYPHLPPTDTQQKAANVPPLPT